MYLREIEIESTGPIDYIKLMPDLNNGAPKPQIIVGENGSGKSILLAHIVNSLLCAKQVLYQNVEVENGKVYKLRSANYIRSGANFSRASVSFGPSLKCDEWQLRSDRRYVEETLGVCSTNRQWADIPMDSNNYFKHNFQDILTDTESLIDSQCCLYFPVNRFEDHAWLNVENLKGRITYSERKHYAGISDRQIIHTSPLRDNLNWLLDVAFDRTAYDLLTVPVPIPTNNTATTALNISAFLGFHGPNSDIFNAVTTITKSILQLDGAERLGFGPRNNRVATIVSNDSNIIPNLFQLSTGELLLLDLFISIIRDFDTSNSRLTKLTDIRGIVVVDEIDAHLHTRHQRHILPKLMSSFPNVQFIVTTHSPLLLKGLEEAYGEDGIEIHQMPTGQRILPEEFSEFSAAYDEFQKSTKHREEIRKEIEKASKAIVFVEGDYDIKYINKAATLLGKQGLLDSLQLVDGGGFGNLDKVWKAYDNSMSLAIPNIVILLYDCDTNKKNTQRNRIYKRVISQRENADIAIGVENLFPNETMCKAAAFDPKFFDISPSRQEIVRGVPVSIPAKKSVNKDEKLNLCNWLCENGDASDFRNFEAIFSILESIIPASGVNLHPANR